MARAFRSVRAVCLLALLALTNCSKIGVGGLPSGWASKDIGAVGSTGDADYASGAFSASGSGTDIWDTSDAFRFIYRALNGDGELKARVVSLDNTDGWAKAGVMIRESLDAGSKFAMTVVTPANGVSFQYRSQTGQGCSLSGGPAVTAPYWVRIVRQGNLLTGYASPDGSAWTSLGSQTISMAASVYLGLCVTAHNNAALANAEFDSVVWTGAAPGGGSFDPAKLGPDVCLITGGVIDGDMHGNYGGVYVQVVDPATLPAGNHAPVVNTVAASPTSIAPFGTVQLTASATDADGDPLRYAWLLPAGENTCSPTSTETWKAPSQPGTYVIQVMVSDGYVWSRGSVSVQVTGPAGTTGVGNHAPALHSCIASAVSVAPGQTVQLTMDAADVEGDELSYAWATPCGGSISGSGATVTWTAPAVASGRRAKAGLWIWNRTLPSGCPVPLSTDMPGIAFVGRTHTEHFCDTFMPSWASDGSMYTPWQDGSLLTPPFRGIGGWHAGDSTALNGWAKLVGNDPQDFLIPNAGELAGPRGNWSGRYPAAFVAKDGVLYYGVRSTATFDINGNLTTDGNQIYRYTNGTFNGFYTSTDGGQSWSNSPDPASPLFPEGFSGNKRFKFGQPYMVDLGKNQEHSPDGKLYFVSNGGTATDFGADHINDDHVYLCRVAASAAGINNISNWEFYKGNGAWSHTLSDAQPIFEWRNQVSGATMTWNPGLQKFLMLVFRNGYTINGATITFGEFDTYMLESDQMTGPWKLVHHFPSFGKQGYYPNLPTKFISSDGRNAWLWYGANFAPFDREQDPPGAGYHLSEQRIRFLTAADTP